MNNEQNSPNSHEDNDIPANDTGEGSGYSEAMGETLDYQEHVENIKNRDRGELVNEAVLNNSDNDPKDADEGQETAAEDIGPFWQDHPELFEEAKQMNAPLTPEEFKKAGFTFGREDDGEMHVWATTPQYQKWQESGGEGELPRHYENLKD